MVVVVEDGELGSCQGQFKGQALDDVEGRSKRVQRENVALRCLLGVAKLFQDCLGTIHSGPLLRGTSLHEGYLVPVLVPFLCGLEHLFGIFCKDPQTVGDLHQAHTIAQICHNDLRDVQEFKLLDEVTIHLQHDVDGVVNRL